MRRRNRKNVLVTLVISYLVVLLIPMISMGIVYINNKEFLQEEIRERHFGYLQQNVESADFVISNLSNLMSDAINNPKINAIANYSNEELDANRYDVIQDRKLYLNYGNSDILEEMFVYFVNTDFVSGIRGCGSGSTYFQYYYQDRFESSEEWELILKQKHTMEYIAVEKQGEYTLFYVTSIIDPATKKLSATVVFEIKQEALLSLPEQEGEFSIIANKDKRILLVSGNSNEEQRTAAMECCETDAMEFSVDKDSYIAVKIESSNNGWNYIQCINKNRYMREINRNRNIVCAVILLCLLFSAAMVWYLSKKQYEPIRKIVTVLSGKGGISPEGKNEYLFIEDTISRIIKEKNQQASQNWTEQKTVQELALGKILSNENCDIKVLQMLKKEFKNPEFMVIALGFEDLSNMFFEDGNVKEQNEDLAKIVVCNIFGDILSNEVELKNCDLDGRRYIVVTLTDREEESEIYDTLSYIQNFTAANFNFKFVAGVSDIHKSLESLSQCTKEAMCALEHRWILSDSIIRYGEIHNTGGGSYFYPFRMENQLISLIKVNDYERCEETVDNIIKQNIGKEVINPITMQCLRYDMLATVLKAMDESDIASDDVLEKNTIMDMLAKSTTMEETRKFLLDIIRKAGEAIGGDEGRNEKKTVQKVCDYIEQNYDNAALTVAGIAEEIGFGVSYLSRMFKKHTGKTMLEYIVAVRIEIAKSLLKESGYKLEEIALKVGYESVRTFSRVFTKYEGVAPGKYRKL